MKITETKYDGYFIVNENGKLKAYEGYGLCPKKVQKEIDNGNYKTIDCSFMEALQYGYV